MNLRRTIADIGQLPGEISLKQFCLIESQRTGVLVESVWKRLLTGCYPKIKRRALNARVVYVSGPADLNLPKIGGKFIYDFAGADWSLPDAELAAQLGCDRGTVRYRRANQ